MYFSPLSQKYTHKIYNDEEKIRKWHSISIKSANLDKKKGIILIYLVYYLNRFTFLKFKSSNIWAEFRKMDTTPPCFIVGVVEGGGGRFPVFRDQAKRERDKAREKIMGNKQKYQNKRDSSLEKH